MTGWNAGSARLIGYAADEILGKPLSLVCSQYTRDILRAEVVVRLESVGQVESEVLFRKKSGETFIYSPHRVVLSEIRNPFRIPECWYE